MSLAGAREQIDLIGFHLSQAQVGERLSTLTHLAGLPDGTIPDEGPPVYKGHQRMNRKMQAHKGRITMR